MYHVADEEGAVGVESENTVVIQYATRASAKTAQTNLIKEILQDIRYRRDQEMIVIKGNRMNRIFAELQKLHNAHLDDLLLKKGPGVRLTEDEVKAEKKWIGVATADYRGACDGIHDHLNKVKAAMLPRVPVQRTLQL